MMMIEFVLLFVGGLALGALAAWLVGRPRARETAAELVVAREAARNSHDEAARRSAEVAALRVRLEHATAEHSRLFSLEQDRAMLATELAEAQQRGAELKARLGAEVEKSAERRREADTVGERMRVEFQALAAQILEDKSKRFTEQNAQQIGALLDPMRVQLGEFKRTVAEAYDKESRERLLLKAEIEKIGNLNVRLSEDAHNLTRALKGDSRAQGNWGELALERLLEAAGLTRGREYETQASFNDAEGERFRPDVLVRLPESRHLVIDAKVSLNAYERFCTAVDAAERAGHLAEHLAALRAHVKGLGEKGYANLDGVSSLDFVLLFVPIEAAFIEAVRHDDTLYDFALGKNIVIVCPSTLLATLRIVSNLWRIETQNRNAQLIAKRAGDLYDKFVGFASDMDDVGKSLGKAQEAHDNAMSKLKLGKGNLVRRTEQLRKLGAKSGKRLPQALVDESESDAEADETSDHQ